MGLSVRTRFEVFKRDRFTCHYCGRTPPDVLLECDHVVPRAAGGTDDESNLITSCQDCNRGKSAGLLEEGSQPVSQRTVDALAERVAQAEASAQLHERLRQLQDLAYSDVVEAWARSFGAKLEEREDGTYWAFKNYRYRFPQEASVRTILRRLPLADVLEAVDIAASWDSDPTDRTCRYFYGVCWRRIRENQP